MNFTELVQETYRNQQMKRLKLSKRKIKEVLIYALRTVVCELMADPSTAAIKINGFGSLYLSQYVTHSNTKLCKDENGKIYYDHTPTDYVVWKVMFRPSVMFKDIINGRKPVEEWRISGTQVFRKQGRPKKAVGGRPKKYTKKKPEKIKADVLPDED